MREVLAEFFSLSLVLPELARPFPAIGPFVGSIAQTIERRTLQDYAVPTYI